MRSGGQAMRYLATAAVLIVASATGCLATGEVGPHPMHGTVSATNTINVPPPGSVPRELEKITLPPYVIEPPDLLSVEVVTILEDQAAAAGAAKEYKAYS